MKRRRHKNYKVVPSFWCISQPTCIEGTCVLQQTTSSIGIIFFIIISGRYFVTIYESNNYNKIYLSGL